MNLLTFNLLFSTLIFAVAAKIYLMPKLSQMKIQTVMIPILLLHSFRHLGLMFIMRGASDPNIPSQFAYPAAIGDLLAAVIAISIIPAVMKGAKSSRLLVWIFNLEGTIDLLMAITLATTFNAAEFMGPAYWIPAFWVPALLVTHYITFVVLRKNWKG
jgi:hypothetical protein